MRAVQPAAMRAGPGSPTAGSARWRPHLPLAAVLVLGFTWRAVFIYRDVEWLANCWLFEDYGYSLRIAWNIARGLGETFDGVVPTNGYQPLYVWLMVPVFWLFPNAPTPPLYVAVTLLAVANTATAGLVHHLLTRLTGQRAWGLVGALLWLLNLAVAHNGTLGLEAGLSTFMVAAVLTYCLHLPAGALPRSRALVLGGLLGLAFLARVDAVFLIGAVSLLLLLRPGARLGERLVALLTCGAAASVLMVPYAVWNAVHFGSPLPTSGQVTTGKSSLFSLAFAEPERLAGQISHGLFIVGRMLVGLTSWNGFVYPPTEAQAWVAPAVGVALLGLALGAWRQSRADRWSRQAVMLWVLTAALYLFGYTVYTHGVFERYFLPVPLLVLLLSVHLVAGLTARRTKARALALVGAGALLCSYLWNAQDHLLRRRPDYVFGWKPGIDVLNRITAPGDVVAGQQSGNLGYLYRNGRAINLDGVVNMEAYQAARRGTLDVYLEENRVKYLADQEAWELVALRGISDPERRSLYQARLELRHASPDYAFRIHEIGPDLYRAVRKPPLAEGWHPKHSVLLPEGSALFAFEPGVRLEFSAEDCFDLRFARHPWAGKVRLLKNGQPLLTQDLYAPALDPTFKLPILESRGRHTYTLEVTAERNPAAQGFEVWLVDILERKSCQDGRTH